MATLILRSTHSLLEKKMKDLDQQKKDTAVRIREAASDHGDLKENAEYHAAREEQKYDCAENTNFTNTFTVSNR